MSHHTCTCLKVPGLTVHTFVSSPKSLKGTGYGILKGKSLKVKAALSNWKSMRMSCPSTVTSFSNAPKNNSTSPLPAHKAAQLLTHEENASVLNITVYSELQGCTYWTCGGVCSAFPKYWQARAPSRNEPWDWSRVCVGLCFHLHTNHARARWIST